MSVFHRHMSDLAYLYDVGKTPKLGPLKNMFEALINQESV